MTLNQLIYFNRAAKLQHFNLAADSLHISEPSLSRSMRSLEEELGVSLFEKRGRNVTLTKAGLLFLSHVEVILEDIHNAQRKMQEIATDGGHINVGYVAPLALEFLPSLIREYTTIKENENVVFDFFEGYTEQLIHGLKSREYDIIFGSYDEKERDVEFVPIIQQDMVVIVSKKNPLAQNEYIDHNDFLRSPVLSYDKKSGLGKATQKFFKKYDVNANVSFSFPHEASIASFVAEDFGIALVADVEEIHREDIIIKQLVPEERFQHTIYVGYLREVYQLPAFTRFVQYIKDKYHTL